jgi:hypothetical protein
MIILKKSKVAGVVKEEGKEVERRGIYTDVTACSGRSFPPSPVPERKGYMVTIPGVFELSTRRIQVISPCIRYLHQSTTPNFTPHSTPS